MFNNYIKLYYYTIITLQVKKIKEKNPIKIKHLNNMNISTQWIVKELKNNIIKARHNSHRG